MFMLCFNVPVTHVEIVKDAIFAAGAGTVGHYKNCSWQILGEGQFMPLQGSHAFIGTVGKLEKVAEYKVETICTEDQIKDVIAALKKAHPYEVPSYQVWRFENL